MTPVLLVHSNGFTSRQWRKLVQRIAVYEPVTITCGLNRDALVALRARTARNVLDKIENLRRALWNADTAVQYLRDLRELCAPR